MKTVTDREIIKAFKKCNLSNEISCEGCAFMQYSQDCCIDELSKSVLELIDRQAKKINKLKSERDKLKLEMSYMVNPNSIGDRHEMGCW